MKSMRSAGLLLIAAVIISSCQKEYSFEGGPDPVGGNNNTGILDDWKFAGLSSVTNATIAASAGGMNIEGIAESNFTSQDNAGTVTITPDKFSYTGVSYNINTTVNLQSYMNGALINQSDEPFIYSSPSTGNSVDYVRNNEDSLTFANPPIDLPIPTIPGNPSLTLPAGPLGAKIAWSGDTLLLRVKYSFSGSFTQNGVPATFDASSDNTIKLVRL